MNKRKFLSMFLVIFILMFGVISSSYATDVSNTSNVVEETTQTIQTTSNAEKYKKILEIQKGSQATATKMPRTGIEDNPLLFVANVCFSAAAVGIVFVLIYSVVKKINLK